MSEAGFVTLETSPTPLSADAVEERLPSIEELKQRCSEQLAAMRGDHVRSLNPTPYKVGWTRTCI